MIARIKEIAAREWAMISTRLGTLLLIASTIAPQLAQIDVRFAYLGAAAGLLLILKRENSDAAS